MELNPLPSWDYQATLDTFRNGTFHGVYKGLELQKSDDDLERYRTLVDESNPDLVIETGTRAGGSAVWFHDELNLQVVSIDVAPQFSRGAPSRRGLEFLIGSSIGDAAVKHVAERLAKDKGLRVMVSLDADHHSPHVQAEIHTWAQFVSPGCYLVVEDACFDVFARKGDKEAARVGGSRIPEVGGTLDALERCFGVPTHVGTQFWRDAWLEQQTPVSHSPVGWWRRHDGV